jgi:CheY-like chemotaxis protein
MRNSASKTNPLFKSLQGLQILLAEDNLLNTKLISVLFAQQGLTIQLAANGIEAVEKIRSTHFDLVLMDMEMPVMNGYDATVIIRNELKNDIPIIALTAHAGTDEKQKCMLLGMNDYISKPIDSIHLFNSIHTLTRQNAPLVSTFNLSTPAITISDKICNLDYLIGATHGNKKVIHSIVGVFFKETKKELTFLDAAIRKTNYPVIRDISHKIKSAFSILGISILEPVFTEMEQLSSSTNSIANIELLNRRVNLIFKQAKAEMRQVN